MEYEGEFLFVLCVMRDHSLRLGGAIGLSVFLV